MIHKLELFDKDFKADAIKILQQSVENSLEFTNYLETHKNIHL